MPTDGGAIPRMKNGKFRQNSRASLSVVLPRHPWAFSCRCLSVISSFDEMSDLLFPMQPGNYGDHLLDPVLEQDFDDRGAVSGEPLGDERGQIVEVARADAVCAKALRQLHEVGRLHADVNTPPFEGL